MIIKGLENLITVVGKNGEIRQGLIEWIPNTDEFWMDERGRVKDRIWCKLDWWTIKEGISIGNIRIIS